MYTPLLSSLRSFADTKPLRLHMPGHHGAMPLPEWSAAAGIDFTELSTTGDLFGGEGAVMEAQQLWADRLGMDACLFLTCGSTQGNHTALTLTCAPSDSILVDRGSHRSIYHAMALLDLHPVYLSRPWLAEDGVTGPIDPLEVDRALTEHPEIKTVCITSPTYYGVLSDLREISAVTHAHGAKLVVDAAHGAHLPWLLDEPFPGVDLLVTSAHKGLPAPGQTALLLARGYEQRELRRAGAIYGSSSPSYPMMAALDWVRAWMDEAGGPAYRETARLTAALRRRWPSLQNGVELDPTRFVWTVPDGPAAQRALEEQGVFPEMSDAGHVVFILTCQDGPAELERLEEAMKRVDLSTKSDDDVETLPPPPPFPTAVLSPRQALFAPTERVVLAQAEGRIAASQIAPYPPGVPVLAPGEVIQKKYLAYLNRIGYNITKETEVVQTE